MHIYRHSFGLFLLEFILASCAADINFLEDSISHKEAETTISGGNLSVLFSSDAGSTTVELEATGKWTASFADNQSSKWCSISTESGNKGKATIRITVQGNTEYDQRTTSINFVCGKVQKKIVVTQKQKDAILINSIGRIDVGEEGGTISVETQSNIQFRCLVPEACSSWISPTTTKAMSTSSFSFIVAENDIPAERSGWIVFKNDELRLSDSVRVVQGFKPIVVPCEPLKASCNGWTVFFETTGVHPEDYKIELINPWLSLAGHETADGKTRFFLTVESSGNKSDSRDGKVLVYFKDYPIPETVMVHQYEQLPSFSYTVSSPDITIPTVKGDNCWGFVFWGDDTREMYEAGLTHHYQTPGIHTVNVEINGYTAVPITGLENGMTINLKGLRK